MEDSLAKELTKEFYGNPRWETEPDIPELANIGWIRGPYDGDLNEDWQD